MPTGTRSGRTAGRDQPPGSNFSPAGVTTYQTSPSPAPSRARGDVADERVEQVAVVRDLLGAIGLRGDAQLRRIDAVTCDRRAVGNDRRPVRLDACGHGTRRRRCVGLEEVHGHPRRVHEDLLAERRVVGSRTVALPDAAAAVVALRPSSPRRSSLRRPLRCCRCSGGRAGAGCRGRGAA